MKKLFFLFVLCLSLLQAKTLVFTAIPDQDETKLKERFDKLATYLESKLAVDVKFVPVKSYGASVSAFRNNEVQLAWFGGLSGVRARLLVEDSLAIAQGVEDRAFETYIIANTSTGLNESKNFPNGIEGKTFTFGSKGSTSGRLMPEFFIREHLSKSPRKAFRRVGFSGSHTKTIKLVESGAYQVGAVNFKVWERELKAGNIDTSKVKVIWKTPQYPDYQFSVRGDVEEQFGKGFINKLQTAILNLKDEKILAAFPRSGFIPAVNSDYKPILDTAKNIGLID